jgi:plasmid rolling circle replication initiator protein Rep
MSDVAPGGTCLTTSLPSEPPASNSSHVSLSDVSPQDKPWDKHRSFADAVKGLYRGSEFDSYSTRIHFCSELLHFGLVDDDGNALKLKLRSARFCRVRHCPVCQWRRSLMWKAKAYKLLPKIIENVPITDLRDTLTNMNRSFQRFSQLKAFPAVGWLRSTEITRGRDGNAHPHFHCLLMVPPGYFAGQNYIKQSQWMEMWRKSMRLDYEPVIDVRAIKQGSQPMQLIPELLKYCTKESDMVHDREWLLELTRQMNKMRSIATGGLLKEYLKGLEDEPEDLIGKDDEVSLPDEIALYFGWKRVEQKYRMVNSD